jgi:hypothetical protein
MVYGSVQVKWVTYVRDRRVWTRYGGSHEYKIGSREYTAIMILIYAHKWALSGSRDYLIRKSTSGKVFEKDCKQRQVVALVDG